MPGVHPYSVLVVPFLTSTCFGTTTEAGRGEAYERHVPPDAAPAIDPIYAAIERHKAAGVVWDAAVDVRADFPQFPRPMTDEQWEQCAALDEAVDDARFWRKPVSTLSTQRQPPPLSPDEFVAVMASLDQDSRQFIIDYMNLLSRQGSSSPRNARPLGSWPRSTSNAFRKIATRPRWKAGVSCNRKTSNSP